jgi:hypothetical protein
MTAGAPPTIAWNEADGAHAARWRSEAGWPVPRRVQLADDTLPADAPASKRAAYQAKLDDYSAKIKKYDAEKEDIQRTAHELEAKRDDAQRHGQPMGLAVIFLQIAILLSSVAGLFKRRELWLCALPLGLLGLVLFANGFLLFLPPLL